MSQIVAVILDVNGDYESAADGTVKVMSQAKYCSFFVGRLTTAITKHAIANSSQSFVVYGQPFYCSDSSQPVRYYCYTRSDQCSRRHAHLSISSQYTSLCSNAERTP